MTLTLTKCLTSKTPYPPCEFLQLELVQERVRRHLASLVMMNGFLGGSNREIVVVGFSCGEDRVFQVLEKSWGGGGWWSDEEDDEEDED